MSWLDDLKTRATQSLENVGNNVGSYLGSLQVDSVIKTGAPAGGNQTAVQIAQGQFGSAPGMSAPNAPPNQLANAAQASMFGMPASSMLPILAIGAVALIFILKKGR